MKLHRLAAVGVAVVLSSALVSATAHLKSAETFEITRSTIDGGGVMRSTGGGFELSATIGQHDAGTLTGVTMAGETLELNGGFWFPLVVGDCLEDGGVGLGEYYDFFTKQCLKGPGAATIPACNCYDLNRNGVIDLSDIHELQRRFTGS